VHRIQLPLKKGLAMSVSGKSDRSRWRLWGKLALSWFFSSPTIKIPMKLANNKRELWAALQVAALRKLDSTSIRCRL
jgi:hypothetical protein